MTPRIESRIGGGAAITAGQGIIVDSRHNVDAAGVQIAKGARAEANASGGS